MGKIETKQPEPEVTEAIEVAPRKPVLIVAVGRQRVGKTTLLNALTETYRGVGADIEVWNADLHNRSHTLSLFHPDAIEPTPGTGTEDQRTWLEERVRDQVLHRRDAVLDVGGGVTALNALVEEIRLVDMLERRGIQPVLLYVLGNDPADLDYLERFAEDSLFLPQSTVLVFNQGLVKSGRSAQLAFSALREHPTVVNAVLAGAKIAQMPSLSCISAVTERGLGFAGFASGKQAEGFPETSFFDQERVLVWFGRALPKFFLDIPAEWMPRTTQPLAPTV